MQVKDAEGHLRYEGPACLAPDRPLEVERLTGHSERLGLSVGLGFTGFGAPLLEEGVTGRGPALDLRGAVPVGGPLLLDLGVEGQYGWGDLDLLGDAYRGRWTGVLPEVALRWAHRFPSYEVSAGPLLGAMLGRRAYSGGTLPVEPTELHAWMAGGRVQVEWVAGPRWSLSLRGDLRGSALSVDGQVRLRAQVEPSLGLGIRL
jgi:hypothetical protein